MSPVARQAIKRALDLVFAIACVPVVGPLLLVTGIIALLVQGRPLLYISPRYVAVGRAIKIYKFRSMVLDAREPRHQLRERFMRDGYLYIPLASNVYTPLGRVLERTQIVEFPQILHVLFHGMSWVGNRALPEENVRLLGQFPGWEERFDSPCGLTGISQVVGKMNLTPIQRITLERAYARVFKMGNILKCDALILLATVRLIIFDRCMSYDEAVALLERCR